MDDEEGLIDKRVEAFDWAGIPDPITTEWLRTLRVGDLLALERGSEERLNDEQRAQLLAAREDAFPEVAEVAKAFANTALGRQIKIEKIGNWAGLSSAHEKLRESFGRQSDIIRRDRQENAEWMKSITSGTALSDLVEAERVRDSRLELRAERQHQLTMEMAHSMGLLATLSEKQAHATDRQRALNWMLAFAVLFEVANSTVDEHSVGTSIGAAGVAGLLLSMAKIAEFVFHGRQREGS